MIKNKINLTHAMQQVATSEHDNESTNLAAFGCGNIAASKQHYEMPSISSVNK